MTDFRIARWLFASFAFLYMLTSGGHFYASDDVQKFQVLDAFVRTGDFSFQEGWGIGVDGRRYSWFPFGSTLLMVPGYMLGRIAAAAAPMIPAEYAIRFAITLQNAVISAGLVALIFSYLRGLAYARAACLVTATALGLGTMLWPYAKTAWSEPATALFLFGAFVALQHASRAGLARWRTLLLAGICLAGAISVRQETALIAPGALVWLVWRHHPHPQALGRAFAIMAIPLAGAVVIALWYNQVRYGQLLAFSNFRSVQENLVMPPGGRPVWALLNGYHYTVNPSDGLFWFSPPIILGLLGIKALYRDRPEVVGLLTAAFVPLALFYVAVWGLSDWAWGLRYGYVFIPFLLIPLAALWQSWPTGRPWWSLIIGIGVAVQAVAVLHNFNFLYERERERHPKLSIQQIMERPSHAPLWLALKDAPPTVAGGLRLLAAPRPASGAPVVAYRERAQWVPDTWPFLLLLTPMSRVVIAAAVLALLIALAGSLVRLRAAFISS